MSLEVALLGYAGLANLAQGKQRRAGSLRSAQPRARIIGWFLLLASLLAAAHRFGPYQAVPAWLALLSASGVTLVLVHSRWPAIATAPWMPMAAIALTLCLV